MNKGNSIRISKLLAPILAIWITTGYAHDGPLMEDAKKLLNVGEANKAYLLLEDHLEEHAGEKEFDYLLGLAALESGKPGEAIFSLTRAVAIDRKFGGAHVELGRAYFAVKSLAESKASFERALALDPPQNLRSVIDQYLSMINSISNRALTYNWLVEVGVGIDSNANAATDDRVFGPWILNDQSVEQASSVKKLNTGGELKFLLSRRTYASMDMQLTSTEYPNASFVTNEQAEAGVVIGYKTRKNDNNLRLQTHRFWLDKTINNKGTQLSFSHNNQLNRSNTVGVTAKTGQLRYQEQFSNRDVNQIGLALDWKQSHSKPESWMHTMSLSLGQNTTVDPDSIYGKTFASFQTGVQLGTSRRTSLFGYAGINYGEYDGKFKNENLGDASRSDRLLFLTVGTYIRPIKSWAVKPQVLFMKQNSSLDLYDFERLNFVVSVRHTLGN